MLIRLENMGVFDKLDEIVAIMRQAIKHSSEFRLENVFELSRERFFWKFPSFDKYLYQEPGSFDIEVFLWCRRKIMNHGAKIMFSKANSRDIRWMQIQSLRSVSHMKTLSMLQYFVSGAHTENYIDVLIPILEYYLKNILFESEEKALVDEERSWLTGILQDLKLFNKEKFNLVLKDVSPRLTPEEIYSKLKELELDYLKKIMDNKNRSSRLQEDIEDFFIAEGLNFEKGYFIDINHVNFYIPSLSGLKFKLPSEDSLIIEILTDSHICRITKTFNL